MAYKTSYQMLEEMTPEQRKKALESVRRMQSENQVLVTEPDGYTHWVPESIYRKAQMRAKKESQTLPESLNKKMISKQEG